MQGIQELRENKQKKKIADLLTKEIKEWQERWEQHLATQLCQKASQTIKQ